MRGSGLDLALVRRFRLHDRYDVGLGTSRGVGTPESRLRVPA